MSQRKMPLTRYVLQVESSCIFPGHKNIIALHRNSIITGYTIAFIFIASVLKVKPECEGISCTMRNVSIIVDPLLFRDFAITKVPAALFEPNMTIESYCNRSKKAEPQKTKSIVFGDASLVGLLKALHRLSKDQRILPLVNTLEGA